MAAAAKHDFTIKQGATLDHSIVWQDSNGAVRNLAGYTARMQARYGGPDGAIALDLTTENGGIVITAAAGTVTLKATAAMTAALVPGVCVYDLEMVHTATVEPLVEGTILIAPEVTR